MAESEPDLPPAVVALQQMLLLVIGSFRAALDAAEQAVRDPETVRAATQVLGGIAGLAAPLLAEFAAFAQTVPAAAPGATPAPAPAATPTPGATRAPAPAATPGPAPAQDGTGSVADAPVPDAGHRAA